MKLTILRRCPEAALVDVTHGVARHDLIAASIALERAIAATWPGAVHLAVIDPGVGSDRRILVAHVAGQWVVCPDNGLPTWAWERHGRGRVFALARLPPGISATFHGRDVMAPIAADLAAGRRTKLPLRAIDDPKMLNLELAKGDSSKRVPGRIIHIDHFGNATTNIPAGLIAAGASVRIGRRLFGPIHQTYSDVAIGRPLAIIGSSGLVEIAVREGSAARDLHIRIGSAVTLERRSR